jgi:hypothetical protein
MKPPEGKGGQLRLPWEFTPTGGRACTWRVEAKPGGRCPNCGCTPDSPCMFRIDGQEVHCVAAGLLGARLCSRCQQGLEP